MSIYRSKALTGSGPEPKPIHNRLKLTCPECTKEYSFVIAEPGAELDPGYVRRRFAVLEAWCIRDHQFEIPIA